MTNSNNINETKFLSEAIIKGYSKPISKKWDANNFMILIYMMLIYSYMLNKVNW